MPLDWTAYDGFDWAGSNQRPLDEAGRQALEETAADVLGLGAAQRGRTWGRASPPGRYAATVVRIAPGVEHVHRVPAVAGGLEMVGLKLFKLFPDARRESARLVPFHREQLPRLPGLPCPHVQRSLTAGFHASGRGFVVQEWLEGDSLEDLVRRRWPAAPPDGRLVAALLRQLFAGLVVPLWSAGTLWWDIRDANFLVDATGRLLMIDVDSLAAYAGEALAGTSWEQRDSGRATALNRLRAMSLRLVQAQGIRPAGRARAAVRAVWQEELGPVLLRLGRDPAATGAAAAALEHFLDRLARQHLFRGLD